MEMLTDPHAWIAFLTLSALEIVLGIDNIIFISILVSRLPPERRESARITGLALAMLTRIALLFSIVWLTKLTKPLITLPLLGNTLLVRLELGYVPLDLVPLGPDPFDGRNAIGFDDSARGWLLGMNRPRERHRLFDERIKISFPVWHGDSPEH